MRRRNGWFAAWALVFCGSIVLPSSGYGADKEKSDKPSASPTAADDDDDVEYHAALGVSVVESGGKINVVAAAPGSPAARAGVRAGDEIRRVDDKRVHTTKELVEEIRGYHPGSHVELAIRRNGERQVLKVKLGSESQFHNQQFRALQREVARLQQEIEALRATTSASRRRPAFDASQWQREQRMGEADDDPALFQ